MNDQPLRNFYNFDESDLNANRSQRITEKQTRKLAADQKTSRIAGIGCSLVLFAIALLFGLVLVIIAVFAFLNGKILEGLAALFGALVWVLVWGGVGIFIIRKIFSSNWTKAPLKSVTGPVNIQMVKKHVGRHSDTITVYELHVSGKEFEARFTNRN